MRARLSSRSVTSDRFFGGLSSPAPVLAGLLTAWLAATWLAATALAADPPPQQVKTSASKQLADASKTDKPAALVAVFSLAGAYAETPLGDDLFGGGGESFYQLMTRLKKVRTDDKVKGVVVFAGSTGLGRAQLEEVHAELLVIRKSGRPIFTHTESLSMGGYTLLSAASHISVVPNGDVWLTGVRAESMHVRGLLDMVGVTPDYLTCGAYKSAAETFTHKAPSPAAEENLNWLLDGIFDGQLQLIAKGREVSPKQVRRWIDKGLFSAQAAKQAGIIDAVEYRAGFAAAIEKKLGSKIRLDRKYGRKKAVDVDLSTPFGLLKFYTDLFSAGQRRKSTKAAIAIVNVEGPILAGAGGGGGFPLMAAASAYSTPIRKTLDKVADDDTIKAVVLRVNSPGGSAVGSEVILEATKRVAAKKPLIVSMGDVAGSGGYFVACGAKTIFVQPSTITGSIGVVGGKFSTEKAWGKVGITWKEYHRGKAAGLLSTAKPFTKSERATMQAWMDEIYASFKGHVTKIRGDRLKKGIEDLAGGRVYTGRQAIDLGLADKLGGLDAAIAFAASQAKVDKYEVRVVPKPKGFADILLEALGEAPDDGDEQQLSLRQLAPRPQSLLDLTRPYLKQLSPGRVAAIQMGLQQLEVMQAERATLAMPLFRLEY